ncbi:WD40 repeat domain-containing protein [Sorangium sp. So ce1000]|uniref:WD40 repeat domain-containing protein n=1 Tax=Sorangium sp. So ce1000 TaxID=3133325 RepID=UPI003F610371
MPGVTAGARRGKAVRGKTELPPRWRLDAGDYVVAMDVTRDGGLCAIGTGAGTVLAVDMQTGAVRWRTEAHLNGVLALGFSPSGARLATCGQDEKARLFDLAGALVAELPGGAAWVEHVAWAPGGEHLATASGRTVRIWTARGEPVVETEPLPSTVAALAWRADRAELAAACYGGVYLWSVGAGATSRHLAWQGSLVSMAWSPDGKVIACGSQDRSVHFWRLSTGHDSEMRGYAAKPKKLAWDAQSRLLATGGAPAVTVWDFSGKGPEGTRPIELEGHQGMCVQLAFSPRKGVLASGAQDHGVLLWEPRRLAKPVRYAFLEDEVTALAWHPAHAGLLGADASGTVVFWRVE